jgi:hypothetical protein
MPENLGDDFRACPLHPEGVDRDFIAAARTREPILARAVMEALEWKRRVTEEAIGFRIEKLEAGHFEPLTAWLGRL